MEKKEIVEIIYMEFKKEVGNNTALIIDFFKWLHIEKNELHYLQNSDHLLPIERDLIDKILSGEL